MAPAEGYTRLVRIIERIRLWVNINYTPILYDMVVTIDQKTGETYIRLEPPEFLKQPIPRVS